MILAVVAAYLLVGWWCMFRCLLEADLLRDLIEGENWGDFWSVVAIAVITSWMGIPVLLALATCRFIRRRVWRPGLRPSEMARKIAGL